MRLSNGVGFVVIEVKALGLSADLVFLLAKVVNKKVAKIETSFLPVPDISLSNNPFFVIKTHNNIHILV